MRELDLLNRRIERLNEEISIKAPFIIIKTEIGLIKDACNSILNKLQEEENIDKADKE